MAKKPQSDTDLSYSNIPYGRALIHSSQFNMSTPFEPQGDQSEAIEQLVKVSRR